jgi:hypothetical protein
MSTEPETNVEPETNNSPELTQEVLDSWVVKFAARREQERLTVQDNLRKACTYLKVQNIAGFAIWYSGSGDSGGVEEVAILSEVPDEDRISGLDADAVREDNDQSALALLEAIPVPEELGGSIYGVTNIADWIADRLDDLAPSGYEINDGGQGIIVLDVNRGKIFAHNETNYTTFDCDSFEINLNEGATDADVQN